MPTAPAVPGSSTDTPDGVDIETWRALALVPVKRYSFKRSTHSPEDRPTPALRRKDDGALQQDIDALLAMRDKPFPRSKRHSFCRLPKANQDADALLKLAVPPRMKRYSFKLDLAAASDVAAGDLVGAWQMGSGQVTFTLNANGLPVVSLQGMKIELAPLDDEGRLVWGAENDVLGFCVLRAFTRDHVFGTVTTPDRDENFLMRRLVDF